MKLTLQIKLLPTKEQEIALIDTIEHANRVCNNISQVAFEKKVFGRSFLHKEVYYVARKDFGSQITILCIQKVSQSYKLNKKVQRVFRAKGAISYDCRNLSYTKGKEVSIWSKQGRLKMPYVCHREELLEYVKGEADLVYRNGKFFLYQTIELPEAPELQTDDTIGVDFGINNTITCDDGEKVDGIAHKKYKCKKRKIRRSIQKTNTRSSKRLLKRLSSRESTKTKIFNHTVSKLLVSKCIEEKKHLAIEDLENIKKIKVSKEHRVSLHNWSFYQLRKFLEYKAKLRGIRVIAVPPQNTSKTCHVCKKVGIREGGIFSCFCGHFDADINAAQNIRELGLSINQPDKAGEIPLVAKTQWSLAVV